MRMSVKILAAMGVIAAIVMVGVMLGWFATTDNKSSPSPPPSLPIVPPGPVAGGSQKPGGISPPVLTPTPATNKPPQAQTAHPVANLITNWEEKLDAILGPEGEEAEKARQLLTIFPRLPEEGQVEVVQHLSNLVSDQNYAALGELLRDASLPEDVLEQLMADILNRPNSLKLPVLLDVARNLQHPKAEDAKDLLELYLEEDYGQDWNKWQAKMEEWVKQNPD
jgi:hypothetical protein